MAPKPFKDCIRAGGRVRAIKSSAEKYRAICFKGGKSFAGEEHTRKRKRKKK